MTNSTLARLPGRMLAPIVLVVSGAYLLVYLYRWEWNRALISGLFFLAAEVAYVGSSLRREIRSLAARTEAAEDEAKRRLRTILGETEAHPARPFAWLRDGIAGGPAVFVPVLLGAGMLLSALAFVVERLSAALARSTIDRVTVGHLAALEPPTSGLLSPRPAAAGRAGAPADASRPRVLVRWVAAVVLALLVAGAIDLLADATQSRPAPSPSGTATTLVLEVSQRRARSDLEAAEALVVACRGTLHSNAEVTRVALVGDDRVQIVVEPGLTELRRRRLFGCLEDATLDLVQARVVAWDDLTQAR